jgi:hypothetical protein
MNGRRTTKTFIRAWHEWQHTPEPVSKFRHRRTNAPTYHVECALDHLASNVHSLGSGLISGKNWNYAELASENLDELSSISSELESCAILETEKEEFRRYASVTRRLLEELLKVAKGDDE